MKNSTSLMTPNGGTNTGTDPGSYVGSQQFNKDKEGLSHIFTNIEIEVIDEGKQYYCLILFIVLREAGNRDTALDYLCQLEEAFITRADREADSELNESL